uniref:Fibrinogen C-terminal domain-containing protein n=2 Tax=Amphimedon queenslandica TaxID=400682 RepID=A0A1X7SLA9_AMPQE
MSTDCTKSGSYQHGGLGLYLRVCCNNLGQSVTIRGPVIPKSCPKGPQKSTKGMDSNYISLSAHQEYTVIWRLHDGGGWTVFQRRQYGSADFYRYWTDYEDGFSDLTGEFWLEMSKIHRLTKEGSITLRVDLGDFEGNMKYASYSTFNVSDGSTKYMLTVGGYSGTAGDGLITDPNNGYNHNGMTFTTRDNDNDNGGVNCAVRYNGAWWFNSCFQSHLN